MKVSKGKLNVQGKENVHNRNQPVDSNKEGQHEKAPVISVEGQGDDAVRASINSGITPQQRSWLKKAIKLVTKAYEDMFEGHSKGTNVEDAEIKESRG